MKRAAVVVISAGLLASLIVRPGRVGSGRENTASSKTYYAGETSQGLDLFFHVSHTGATGG